MRRVAVAIAVAVAVAGLGVAAAGGRAAKPRPVVDQGFFVAQHYLDFRGIVGAEAVLDGRAVASVHGLAPEAPYEVVAVTKPCSVGLDEAGVEAAKVFELNVATSAAGDAFVTRPIAANRRALLSARSVRLYETPVGEAFVQRDCVRSLIGAIAGGGKGAAIGAAAGWPGRLAEAFLTGGRYRGILGGALGAGARVNAFASLHGLDPATRYEVAAVTKPCSVRLDQAGVAAATVFELPIASGLQDVFVTERVARGRGRPRSLRLYSANAPRGFRQLACKSAVFIGGGAATGALIGR